MGNQVKRERLKIGQLHAAAVVGFSGSLSATRTELGCRSSGGDSEQLWKSSAYFDRSS